MSRKLLECAKQAIFKENKKNTEGVDRMEEKKYYPTKADISVKDVNLSSAAGVHLAEVIGLWQFANWDECLKILQLLRSARKRDYEARKAPSSSQTVTPSEHEVW